MMRRVFIVSIAALGVLLLCGGVYQAIGTTRDRDAFPAPGHLIDVGGYRLHIHCLGTGSPTVVLDSLGDGNVAVWGWIQPALAELTRTCAYDRAGFGWSEPAPHPVDGKQGARDLHTLLVNAAIAGPYVLVGHSFGTHVTRLFTAAHPSEVAGMVLIDPGKLHPDSRLPPESQDEEDNATVFMTVAPWLARVGLFRMSGQGAVLMGGLPEASRNAYAAKYNATQHWSTLARQNTSIEETSNQVRDLPMPPDLPVVVLSADTPHDVVRPAWTAVNAELARGSSRGEHHVITGATHGGLVTDEVHANEVANVIRRTVLAVRNVLPPA